MTSKITTPTVATITAELNVVKIGNKQMTISVFNQLYQENCWDEEYNILYPIWGKTNRDGQYVIFQKGTELRKSEIPRQANPLRFIDHFLDFLQSKNLEIATTRLNENSFIKDCWERYDLNTYKLKIQKISTWADRKYLVDEDIVNRVILNMDNELKKEHQELFNKALWLSQKRVKMIESLHNSQQLFIAI
jgi:hypothetical protein